MKNAAFFFSAAVLFALLSSCSSSDDGKPLSTAAVATPPAPVKGEALPLTLEASAKEAVQGDVVKFEAKGGTPPYTFVLGNQWRESFFGNSSSSGSKMDSQAGVLTVTPSEFDQKLLVTVLDSAQGKARLEIPIVKLEAGEIFPSFGNHGRLSFENNHQNRNGEAFVFSDTSAFQQKFFVFQAGSLNVPLKISRYTAAGALDASFGKKGMVEGQILDFSRVRLAKWQGERAGKELSAGIFVAGDNYGNGILLSRVGLDGKVDAGFAGGKLEIAAPAPYTELTLQNIHPLRRGGVVAVGLLEIRTQKKAIFAARYSQEGKLDPNFGQAGIVVLPLAEGTDLYHGAEQKILSEMDGESRELYLVGNEISLANPKGTKVFALYLDSNGKLDPKAGSGGKVVADLEGPGNFIAESLLLDDNRLRVGGKAEFHGHHLNFVFQFSPYVGVIRDISLDDLGYGKKVQILPWMDGMRNQGITALRRVGSRIVAVQLGRNGANLFHLESDRLRPSGLFGEPGAKTIGIGKFYPRSVEILDGRDVAHLFIGSASIMNQDDFTVLAIKP
jgi:uncharacterized delta-60 repeat protein